MTIDPKVIAADQLQKENTADVEAYVAFQRAKETNPFRAAQMDLNQVLRGKMLLDAAPPVPPKDAA